MRKAHWAAGVVLALAASALTAVATMAMANTPADLDYSDFDDSLMRTMDDAIRALDSNVGGQERDPALANVAVLRDGLQWAENYFAAKPAAPLGVGFAREGQERLALLVQSIDARDFDAAATHLRGVARSCKACHEAYKPPE